MMSERRATMRFFLAGIMQGSHLAATIHNQDYRQHIKQLLAAHFPGVEVYDPLADHANSLSYDDERARTVFLHHIGLCTQVDVVLAFVPEASMGTAVEIWEAFRHGRIVVVVSPLKHNWALKFLSHAMYGSLQELEDALASGELAARLRKIAAG